MAHKKAKAEEPAGEAAPMWIVSFADLVTLMMSFFVVLYALKSGGTAKAAEITAAIKSQFGYVPPEDSNDLVDQIILGWQGKPKPPMDKMRGRSQNPALGAQGTDAEVTTIRPGQITAGGRILFESGSANLTAADEEEIRNISSILQGKTNIVMIKGHVSADELKIAPDDPDGMSLAYRRATAVAALLAKTGLDARVLRPTACGANEPLRVQVYDDAGLRQNRRVEIFTTDKMISDYFPATTVPPPAAAHANDTPAPLSTANKLLSQSPSAPH